MIVQFANTFHAPGFGRSRFKAGIVRDVPEVLRNKIPKSATILPDDTQTDDMLTQEQDTLAAQDFARSSTDTSAETLAMAGMSGYADEHDEITEPAPAFVLEGKSYKTAAAMKAAITRQKNK